MVSSVFKLALFPLLFRKMHIYEQLHQQTPKPNREGLLRSCDKSSVYHAALPFCSVKHTQNGLEMFKLWKYSCW